MDMTMGMEMGKEIDPEDIAFRITSHESWVINIIMSVGAGTSLLLCTFILLSSAWIYTYPKARHHLDRLSFRLLLLAMSFQVIYDIAHISLYVPTDSIMPTHMGCATGMFFRLIGINVVNYLFTCIAINLMLTIVFEISPAEHHLERTYIGVSLFLGIFIPIVATCLGAFGWDHIFHNCYFAPVERDLRVKHFVFDLYLWQSLSCAIATVSVIVTLVKLFRQTRATRRAATFGTFSSAFESVQSSTGIPIKSPRQRGGWFWRKALSSARSDSASEYEGSAVTMYQLQDKLYGIALRISMYPIVLIVINAFVTAGDLYTAVKGSMHSTEAFWLTSIHMSICGARGLFLASVCIFVDPCLRRGLKAVFAERRDRKKTMSRATGLNDHVMSNLSDQDEKSMLSPVAPLTSCVNYSPTFVPPGETPLELKDDPFFLPSSSLGLRDPSAGPSTAYTLSYNPTTFSPSDIAGPSRRTRNDSEVSMDFAQALTASCSARPGQPSHGSSMDFATALHLGPRTASSPSSTLKSFSKAQSSYRSTANSLPRISDVLQPSEVEPNLVAQTHGPSADSMGMQSALGFTPSRFPSTVSLNIDTVLALGPASSAAVAGPVVDESHPRRPSASVLHSSTPDDSGTRIPSLPRIWKGAFDEEAQTGGGDVNRVDPAREARRQRRQERKRLEWVKGMEKLYEEAESQL